MFWKNRYPYYSTAQSKLPPSCETRFLSVEFLARLKLPILMRTCKHPETKAKQCFACSNKGFIYLLFVYPVHLSPEIQNSESIHLFGKRLKKFPLS